MGAEIYHSKIIPGRKMGKKLGFPTINIADPEILKDYELGVYAARVTIDGKTYKGLLYKGPKLILGEKDIGVEIYLLNFDRNVYGRRVSFRILEYIRGIIAFPNRSAYKTQLSKDIKQAEKIFRTSKD